MNFGVPALGHLSFTIYMYFWMQIVLRSRLLDLKEMLGTRFVQAWHAVKESEYDTFLQVISSWEREHLLLNV